MLEIYEKFLALTKGFERKLIFLLFVAVTQALLDFALILLLVLVLQIFTKWVTGTEEVFSSGLVNTMANISSLSSNDLLIILFMAIALSAGLTRIFFITQYNKLVASLSSALAQQTMESMLASEYMALINYPKNLLIASVTKKVDVTVGLFVIPLVLNLNNFIILLGIIASLMFIDFVATLQIFCSLGLVYFLVLKGFHSKIILNGKEISRGAEDVVSFVDEIIGGVREVFLYRSSGILLQEFNSLLKQYYNSQAYIQILASVPRPLIEAVVLVVISSVGLFAIRGEGTDLHHILPVLGAIIFSLQRMLPLAQQIYANVTVINGSLPTVTDLLDFKNKFECQKSCLAEHSKDEMYWDAGLIAMHGVGFSYAQNEKVLKDININIQREMKFVGLMGESGSGKSTLADLLMGLLVPDIGHVEVGNVEVTSENRGSWMSKVAHVPQNPHIMSGSLTENVIYQSDVIDIGRVNHCLAVVDLTDFISSLKDGCDTIIGLGGRALSGGQKQRIAIARALYRDFNLLVLDEAFNGIDSSRVRKIISNIKASLGSQQKMFLISHIQEQFESADIVVIMDTAGVRQTEKVTTRLEN